MGEATPSTSSDDADALLTKLTDEFRTRLDDTVIIVIASEYDLTQQYQEVHSVLTTIAQDSVAEEASISDSASFHTSHETAALNQASPSVNELSSLEWPDTTETTQSTLDSAQLLSDTSSNTDWGLYLSESFEDLEIPEGVNFALLDEDGKVAELKSMFAGLSEVDLKLTLRKFKGDFTKTCDELLNLNFLEENGLRPKGIEGAFRDERIDYSSRSGTPKDKNQDKGKNRLEVDYKLTPINLSGEESFTKPSTPNTLTRRKSLPRIITTSTPIYAKSTASAPISPALRPTKPTDWQTVAPRKTHPQRASEAAAAHALADQTSQAANLAYIRGKSDPLYRPVAGVFAERAREQRAQARLLDSAKHEAYVDRTASSNFIDLHGVPVEDGVRIALDRTLAWWIGLGEDRARKARQQEFTVVTGLGIHSTSGVSRLRQAVGAALKKEGWYTRIETGQYVITGRK